MDDMKYIETKAMNGVEYYLFRMHIPTGKGKRNAITKRFPLSEEGLRQAKAYRDIKIKDHNKDFVSESRYITKVYNGYFVRPKGRIHAFFPTLEQAKAYRDSGSNKPDDFRHVMDKVKAPKPEPTKVLPKEEYNPCRPPKGFPPLPSNFKPSTAKFTDEEFLDYLNGYWRDLDKPTLYTPYHEMISK